MRKTLFILPVLVALAACVAGAAANTKTLNCDDLGQGHSRGGLIGDSDTAKCNRLRTGLPDPTE